MVNRWWRWLQNHEAVAWLIILSLVLRIPSLFEPYWYGDEGIYLTLGGALKKGLVWYRDIHDNKPPLLYLLAALTGTVFWFRLLLAGWFAATVAVFYRLMQRLLPQQPAAWNLAALGLIGLTTIFEGNIANSEIFIILPTALAILLTLKPRPNYWLVGLLFSAGFLFKVPAAFDFLALMLWLIIWNQVKLKALVQSTIGFLVPIVLTIIYYAFHGALEPYVRSALLQNIGYLSSWQGSQNGLATRFALTAALTGTLLLLRRRLPSAASLPLIWFIWAMFGALLSERPYPHYLIQPAVPLAIMTAFWFFGKRKLIKLTVMTAVLLAGLAYYQIRFWQYPVLGYYQNFWQYLTRQKSRTDYWRWFDRRVPQTHQLAAYIRQTTLPDEKIFIWGDEPYVYALSRRLPLDRYTVAYHVIDFDGFRDTIAAWDRGRPELVITLDYETRPFPELNTRLATDYVLAVTINDAKIYRRLNGVSE